MGPASTRRGATPAQGLALARLRREGSEALEIANRELAEATAAKSEFPATMSHVPIGE
jgi:hypothetical protein